MCSNGTCTCVGAHIRTSSSFSATTAQEHVGFDERERERDGEQRNERGEHLVAMTRLISIVSLNN